jgi:glycosyltransferase involved in cell wall biosynthesis
MALRSVCAQTYVTLDILVADNASTDRTSELVRSFTDTRIRYHRHGENIGSARNTNFCIAQSKGEYTLLLNDDDLIDSDFVAVCMAAIPPGSSPGLIRTGTRIIDDGGAIVRVHANDATGARCEDFIADWVSGRLTPYLCSTMFLTAALQRFGMHSRHHMWDDVLTELRVLAEYGRVDVPTIHASFREHPAEITFGISPRYWIEDSRQLLDVAVELSTIDPDSTRDRLATFLARLDYLRAATMRESLWTRLKMSAFVWRVLGVPPPRGAWLGYLLSNEPWYRRMTSRRWFQFILRLRKAARSVGPRHG